MMILGQNIYSLKPPHILNKMIYVYAIWRKIRRILIYKLIHGFIFLQPTPQIIITRETLRNIH